MVRKHLQAPVQSPKVYVRDSGILHALLRLETFHQLSAHPKLGASWEGFALEQILILTGARDAYFWGTHSGAEIDFLLLRKGKRFGVEFKCTDAPSMTKSLHIALQDLTLDVWVVYPGNDVYPMHKRVTAMPIAAGKPCWAMKRTHQRPISYLFFLDRGRHGNVEIVDYLSEVSHS